MIANEFLVAKQNGRTGTSKWTLVWEHALQQSLQPQCLHVGHVAPSFLKRGPRAKCVESQVIRPMGSQIHTCKPTYIPRSDRLRPLTLTSFFSSQVPPLALSSWNPSPSPSCGAFLKAHHLPCCLDPLLHLEPFSFLYSWTKPLHL